MPSDSPLTITEFRRLAKPYLKPIERRPLSSDQRAEQLRALYALGTVLIDYLPKRSAYGTSPYIELASVFERSGNWLEKVRRFAQVYTPSQLETLCRDSETLGFAHVQHLLAVANRRDRAKLQREAARQGWSVRRLQNEVRRHQAPSRGGGRKLAAKEPQAILLEIIDRGGHWKRFIQSPDVTKALKDLPVDLQELANVASEEVRSLIKVTRTIEKLLSPQSRNR